MDRQVYDKTKGEERFCMKSGMMLIIHGAEVEDVKVHGNDEDREKCHGVMRVKGQEC